MLPRRYWLVLKTIFDKKFKEFGISLKGYISEVGTLHVTEYFTIKCNTTEYFTIKCNHSRHN